VDAFWYFLALRSRSAATTRARAVLSSELARFTASSRSAASFACAASASARRCASGLAKLTAAVSSESVASRTDASPLGCSRFTVEPGETLMMPGL